jgi:hypothetical protein
MSADTQLFLRCRRLDVAETALIFPILARTCIELGLCIAEFVRKGLSRNAANRFNADGIGGARASRFVPCRRRTAPGIAAAWRILLVEHCR